MEGFSRIEQPAATFLSENGLHLDDVVLAEHGRRGRVVGKEVEEL